MGLEVKFGKEEKKEKKEKTEKSETKKRIALRDFVLHHNEYHYEIKKGDDLSKIPVKFHDGLAAEKVM